MKKQREIDFEKNYSTISFASTLIFSIYCIGFIFLLNLTYIPTTIKNNGFSGIFVLLAYYILSSIILVPTLIISNGFLSLFVKKIMKYAYIKQPLLGFLIFPGIMTIIPILMNEVLVLISLNKNNFDYYFIFFMTWISSIMQYIWILKNIKDSKEILTEKQISFLKKSDKVDYF